MHGAEPVPRTSRSKYFLNTYFEPGLLAGFGSSKSRTWSTEQREFGLSLGMAGHLRQMSQAEKRTEQRSMCQGPVACLEVMAGSQEGTEGVEREAAGAGQEVGHRGSREG